LFFDPVLQGFIIITDTIRFVKGENDFFVFSCFPAARRLPPFYIRAHTALARGAYFLRLTRRIYGVLLLTIPPPA
jgi:hypothetical protein